MSAGLLLNTMDNNKKITHLSRFKGHLSPIFITALIERIILETNGFFSAEFNSNKIKVEKLVNLLF